MSVLEELFELECDGIVTIELDFTIIGKVLEWMNTYIPDAINTVVRNVEIEDDTPSYHVVCFFYEGYDEPYEEYRRGENIKELTEKVKNNLDILSIAVECPPHVKRIEVECDD